MDDEKVLLGNFGRITQEDLDKYNDDNEKESVQSESIQQGTYENSDIPIVMLSLEEKIRCLEEIETKLKKLLYVYDESQKPNSNYNYKVYTGGVLIYVSSSNMLFGGELVNIIVNLNAIMSNNFSKAQIKRIVFESKNYCQYLLTNYRKELDGKDIQTIEDL